MRLPLAAISIIIVAVAALLSFRFPGTPESRWAPYCLAAQFIFSSVCFISAARLGWSSKTYAQAFYGTMAVLILTAFIFTLKSISNFPATGMAVAVGIGSTTFVSLVCLSFTVSLLRSGMLNAFSFAHVFCSGAFLLCGALTLVSMAFSSDLACDAIRGAFGVNWLLQGIYGLSEAGLYLRGRAEAVHYVSMTPTVIIIVVFSVLSIFLSRSQKELSREHGRQVAVLSQGGEA